MHTKEMATQHEKRQEAKAPMKTTIAKKVKLNYNSDKEKEKETEWPEAYVN